METIALSALEQLNFETKSVKFRDKNNIEHHYDYDMFGQTCLNAGEIEITFYWRTKVVEQMHTDSAIYHIEIDHSAPVTATINAVVVDRQGQQLDTKTTSQLLIPIVQTHVGWLMDVDNILSEPRLSLVSSQPKQAYNPHSHLIRY